MMPVVWASVAKVRRRAALAACCAAVATGQFPQMQAGGAAPSPSSLLNDLRAIQFPPGGHGGGAQPGQGFGGLGMGGLPQGTGLPSSAGLGAMGFGAAGSGGSAMGGGGFGGALGGNSGGASPFGGGPFGGASPGGAIGGMGMGFGGMGVAAPPPAGGASMAPPGGSGAGIEEPMDLDCAVGPRAAAWASTKQRFSAVFAGPHGAFKLASKEALNAAMEGALNDLKAVGALSPEAANECGLGKLSLQLLSFATVDDPTALVQLFAAFEQLASPVLTMLLDVPWAAVAAAGWPLFGLLGQLNFRKQHVEGALNTEAMDGMDDAMVKAFQVELAAAVEAWDMPSIAKAGATFMEKEHQGSALVPLTALAAQSAGATKLEERGVLLQAVQQGFKQVIGSGAELDIALATTWPLWGLLHMSVSSFSPK
mmetsp:Transcript_35981/g.99145  ORF Transcript_35981/g.99145 Transcript_35981/m.99145 type:complete len:424 (+) Transcript_35981:89-1360(+)